MRIKKGISLLLAILLAVCVLLAGKPLQAIAEVAGAEEPVVADTASEDGLAEDEHDEVLAEDETGEPAASEDETDQADATSEAAGELLADDDAVLDEAAETPEEAPAEEAPSEEAIPELAPQLASKGTLPLNNSWKTGSVAERSVDTWTVKLTSDGLVTFTLQGRSVRDVYFTLRSADSTYQYFDKEVWYSSATEPKTTTEAIWLKKGTYQLLVHPYGSYSGTYGLSAQFKAANNKDKENNDTFGSAQALAANTRITGLIHDTGSFTGGSNIPVDVDFYKISVPSAQTITIQIGSYDDAVKNGMRFYLYDSTQIQQELSYTNYWGGTSKSNYGDASPASGAAPDTYKASVKKGTYYLKVGTSYGSRDGGRYTLRWTGSKLPVAVTKVTVSGTKTMTVGQKATAKATVSPSNASNKSVTWKSSNTAVATVSASGVVTAKKAGTATITATAKDGSGKKGSYKVTVKKAATSVPVYWLQHKVTGENLYTTDKNEVAVQTKGNWTNKGIKWYAPVSGTPVYRLNFKNGADHHYTTDTNEVTQLKKNKNWKIDFGGKPVFYSGGSVRIYRMNSDVRAAQYNAGKKISGFHMFATSTSEVKSLKASSWKWKQDAVKVYAVKLK